MDKRILINRMAPFVNILQRRREEHERWRIQQTKAEQGKTMDKNKDREREKERDMDKERRRPESKVESSFTFKNECRY